MNIQYQYSTCLIFIKIIFIDCAPKLKILLLDPLLLEPINNTDEIKTKNRILRNSDNHSNNPDPIITTENIRRTNDFIDNELPSSGYDYDSKLCKNVKDKILCGYNKNKGSFSGENIIKLSNGCRIRGERIECGYDSKPLITSKTPKTQYLREGNLISERVLENVTETSSRKMVKLKLNVTETFNTTTYLMNEEVNETEIFTEKYLKGVDTSKTDNEFHTDVTETETSSDNFLNDCEMRKTNNENILKDVTETEIFSDKSLKDCETRKTNNENIFKDVTETEFFSEKSLKDPKTSKTHNEMLKDVTETEIFSDKSLKGYQTGKNNNENILKDVTETEIFSDKSLKDRETKKNNSEMLEHIIETEIFSQKSVKDRETRKNNKEMFNDVTEASETKYSDTSIHTEDYGATGSTLSTTTSTIAVIRSTLTKDASEPYHVYCVDNDDRIVCYKIKY